MVKKEYKQIRARIPDPSIWESFLKYVEDKHGKTYGVIGVELQNVLFKFLEYPEISDIRSLEDKYEQEVEQLKESLVKKSNQYDLLRNNHDRLRNNYDHLQARFNKSQNEVVTLERENSQLRVVVAKIEKLSFLERLFNRLPSEIKQLKGE